MEQRFENKTLDEALRFQFSTIFWILILIFIPLVTAFGICSNFAFIFVVYRVEAMRTITNIFLVNLAIADSSLLIVAFAQYIGSYVYSPVYDFGFSFDNALAFGCVTSNSLTYLCYYASLWTVTLVSVERVSGRFIPVHFHPRSFSYPCTFIPVHFHTRKMYMIICTNGCVCVGGGCGWGWGCVCVCVRFVHAFSVETYRRGVCITEAVMCMRHIVWRLVIVSWSCGRYGTLSTWSSKGDSSTCSFGSAR